jgi:hypothetical protein
MTTEVQTGLWKNTSSTAGMLKQLYEMGGLSKDEYMSELEDVLRP